MNPIQFNSQNIRNNLNQIRDFLIEKVTTGIKKFKVISFKTEDFEFIFEAIKDKISVNEKYKVSDVDNAILLIALEIIEKLETQKPEFPGVS